MITYSVVIPVKDEAGSLPFLYKELTDVLRRLKKSYEVIFVDDGSGDASYQALTVIRKKDSKVKIIKFHANYGKSEALSAGFRLAQGTIVITLDADLQDDPDDIPKFLNALNQGYDVVCGWRQKREDTMVKKISSYLFNSGTKLLTGVPLHDVNCGLKVLRKQVCDRLFIHGELHRFIPILAAKQKFRVTEVFTRNRPRKFGKSKYGLERSWRGIIDLLTTIFITDYATKPAHFFGKIGLIFFFVGFGMDAYVTYIKLITGSTQERLPLLLAGILFMVLGIQLLSTGLIAEMVTHYNKKGETYIVESVVS
ncbi:MAG: Undecaprenyl-phosphate 4-deoxy-4-formamido-L-arabinose transferase [Candidatus Gottesmanbacteria bacterium GW2011_GWA2_47_9]|uniref:Undecaprenyl-phosphate 4-deoxy-4-formamido-L-arabinose transferase n=1 Tax=Candidatus Gottesmanbacteria bacterium GW2011_GWA2_47_9 TaxID=1618445 RepID=A0A0G1U081_9BACT|nr:MAG: Undecaprenyl-phosphate 4-deoxy-4-formamido-L-arabinose transferase [Candidatus Gottesmanbacteria bacterium GW2011_GWA2_47_9]